MFVKNLKQILQIFFVILALFSPLKGGYAQEIFIKFPDELRMIEFDKHILPRFKFKTQIILKASENETVFDASIGIIPDGEPVFSDLNNFVYKFEIVTSDQEKIKKMNRFISWLKSSSGISAIEGFSIDGSPAFKAVPRQEELKKEQVFEGDSASGLAISQKHCKRCHVVDSNAFAGIDSSPSFHAMKSFEDWEERFRAFWTVSPHLNVISISEVYEAGSKSVPVTIAPIELSLEQVDDILAYVASIKPKDLGKPINSW